MTSKQVECVSPLLQMLGISKSFPGVRALHNVDYEVRAGEVHALMGENGAGKSTLIKVLTGVHSKDAGQIVLDGKPISPRGPSEAELAGISTVYQEVQLIPHLSVAENIVLGRQPTTAGMLSWRAINARAEEALRRIKLQVDVTRELGSYSVAIQQMVAIARAVDLNAKLLVLDEPTSSLDEQEVEALFQVMQQLRAEGLGIVFVTHFLDQVYRIADRITILRNGENAGVFEAKQLPRLELIGKMLGKDPQEVSNLERRTAFAPRESTTDEIVLSAINLGRAPYVQPLDLRVHTGEVVGLAGLLGSGRTEIMRLLFGLDRATDGEISVNNQSLSKPTPRRAIAAGIAFCPEDRKLEGVILDLSVRENIMLAMQARQGLAKAISLKKQLDITNRYIQALNIKTPSTETRVGSLSGGNQQKVLLARWFAMEPRLILLDEPTRGVDIGAKAEIEAIVASLGESGMAVLFVSSELEEVIRNCQRTIVMCDRRKIGELTGDQLQENRIMELIAQHHDN